MSGGTVPGGRVGGVTGGRDSQGDPGRGCDGGGVTTRGRIEGWPRGQVGEMISLPSFYENWPPSSRWWRA